MTVINLPNRRTPLRLTDKLLFVVASSLAAGLFLSVGWLAVAPDDPQAAVSLFTHSQATWMVVQAAALAAVTAAIATVIIGTKLADAGVFAAALGLSLVTLRGDTAMYLLIHIGNADRSAERVLAGKLAGEALAWFGVIVVAMLVSGLVMRWCFGAGHEAGPSGEKPARRTASSSSHRVSWSDMSISECPVLLPIGPACEDRDPGRSRRSWLTGLKVTAVTVFVAMCVYAVLVSGTAPRWVRHGQTCFAVFVGFFVGVWAARLLFPSRTAFWELLAPPVACVLGYLWTIVLGEMREPYAHLANMPPSDFLRVLPMTHIAVGSLGVLVAHWTVRDKPVKQPTKSPAPKRRGRR